MGVSRPRLLLLLSVALLCAAVPSIAIATSGAKGKGRGATAGAWTWSKSLKASGRYDVTIKLRRIAGRKAGQDVLQVTGPDGKARRLDAAVLPRSTASFTVVVPSTRRSLRFVVRKGRPAVAMTTVGARKAPAVPVAAAPTAAPATHGR